VESWRIFSSPSVPIELALGWRRNRVPNTVLSFQSRYAAGCSNRRSSPSCYCWKAFVRLRSTLARGKVRTFVRISEPYFNLRISPAALVWATLETFDPFPGALPLWRDVSVFPTSSRLSPPPGSWGSLPILQRPQPQPLPVAFENSSRDQKSHLFQIEPFIRNEPDNRSDVVRRQLSVNLSVNCCSTKQ